MSNDKSIVRVFKLWAKISTLVVEGKRNAIDVANALQLILEQSGASWREEGDMFFFSVTSDGTTGPEWIARLEAKGFRIGDAARSVLQSPQFTATNGVTTEIAILKGSFFTDDSRTLDKIRKEAEKRKLSRPNAEVACLIREQFGYDKTQKTGLRYIIAMHEPVSDHNVIPLLLYVDGGRFGHGVDACGESLGSKWNPLGGFAFAVSETPA